MQTPLISIVSPVYRAEHIVELLVQSIETSVAAITDNFEIILVEDGSPDNSWDKMRQIAESNKRVKAVKLSRNFGQHFAITAGLDMARGEWAVVMDCDLQDRPDEIVNLYNKALEGFDIVLAQRVERADSLYKRMSSSLFYIVFNYLSGIAQDKSISNFGIYNKKVVRAINTMREPMRAFPPMVQWVGFNTAKVKVKHAERATGKTTYTFSKLINLALDIAISYSDKPLKLIVKFGFFISIASFIYTIYLFINYLAGTITVSGYASIILTTSFSLGLIMLTLGIVGLYIGKIFSAVKNRPIYLIDKTINCGE